MIIYFTISTVCLIKEMQLWGAEDTPKHISDFYSVFRNLW